MVNFEPLQKVILESAVAVEGGGASVRAPIIQTIERDVAEFCAEAPPRITNLSGQWNATTPSDAMLPRCPVTVASLRGGEQALPIARYLCRRRMPDIRRMEPTEGRALLSSSLARANSNKRQKSTNRGDHRLVWAKRTSTLTASSSTSVHSTDTTNVSTPLHTR